MPRHPFRALRGALAALLLTAPAMAIEEPRHTVIETDGDIQLRQYAPYLIAETEIAGDFDEAGNAAFSRLFGYISGRNAGERKIAMTAPVVQEPAGKGTKIEMTAPVVQEAGAGGAHRVAFVVPASFTRETVPQPTDARVTIREVPARRMAVLRYSGRWTEKNYRAHEAELQQWLARRGLQAAGPAVYARYNAPFVPWMLRRNEVMIPVGGS